MQATVENVVSVLRSYRFLFASEQQLQEGISAALLHEGFDCEREVRLNSRDRVDFLVGDIKIETKIDGSLRAVDAQLARYSESPRIGSLILVTSCARHAGVSRELRGKPVEVVPTFGGL